MFDCSKLLNFGFKQTQGITSSLWASREHEETHSYWYTSLPTYAAADADVCMHPAEESMLIQHRTDPELRTHAICKVNVATCLYDRRLCATAVSGADYACAVLASACMSVHFMLQIA